MTKQINFSTGSSNTELLMPARGQQEITQHNAMIETQISKLTTQKDAYKRISNKSLSISSELDLLANSAASIGSTLENMIISGKSLDDNNFKAVNNNLQSMSGTFSNIVNTCKLKIDLIDTEVQNLKRQYW